MEQVSKSLKGTVLAALASAILCGHAAAVPTPIYPLSPNPGSEAFVTGAPTPSHAVTSGPGARILSRSGKLTASGRLHGGSSIMGGSASRSSRWKNRYLMSGLVLATLTPLALHRSGEPGDKSIAAHTQAPASASLPALGGRNGNEGGHDRGGNDNKDQNEGRGGNDGNGGHGDDDDGDDDDGDEVCEDDGDHDGGNGGHNGGGDNGGEDDSPGNGDHDGGGIPLPEPGTVPVLGAGLIMALALRSRRKH